MKQYKKVWLGKPTNLEVSKEWSGCGDLDAIEQRANIYGEDAIPQADRDSSGPFHVLMIRHWLGGFKTSSVIMDNMGLKPLEFETYEEAQEWIKAAEDDVYRLALCEASIPSYKVVAVE
jgi:hypothetical protein